MFTEKSLKSPKVYSCDFCNYNTYKLHDFNKHTSTLKHQKVYQCLPKSLKSRRIHSCECGKEYSCKQSLYVHRKTCNIQTLNVIDNNENKDKEDLVNYLMKENTELKQMILDVCKNMKSEINNNINNNTVNSHNKTFNLNVFLNETCKDAMNITEFMDSIQLQLSDLENVGKLGYVNGISKIIINKLNELEETKRPIHCTDPKRETLYIKDENIWKKDNENNKTIIKKVIKRVAFKNCKLIPEFREKYPDCNKYDSRYADQYNKMIVEAMGGSGDNDAEKEEKIIRNIAKEVQINKSEYLS